MTDNAAATWEATLGQLQLQVTRANFDTWLRDTVGLRHEDARFVVGAQSDFATEWLATRLHTLCVKAIAAVLGRPVDVAFEVLRLGDVEPPLLPPPGADDAAPARRAVAPPPALSPRHTFEAYVVGDENRLAYEAARRAVDDPGALNPLLIFAPPGMGKTHLLNAIGHAAHALGRHVVYATGERFGNDYVRARDAGYDPFRARYRSVDLLLIDDFQFFEGKEKFQEEFFHAFNDLHAAGKQIVVACDRRPAELSGLTDRLRSRLCSGLVADLARPEYDTRLAILRAKAVHHALKLPEEALRAIAARCAPSIRELEGYLNRVLAFVPLAGLVGGKCSTETVDRALTPLAAPASPLAGATASAPAPSPDDIVGAVCRRTGAGPGDLRGKSRSRDLAYARHLAMYVLKHDGLRTVAEIGRLLGGRDHATVLAGVRRIHLELTTRPETRTDLAAIRESLAPPPAAAQAGSVA